MYRYIIIIVNSLMFLSVLAAVGWLIYSLGLFALIWILLLAWWLTDKAHSPFYEDMTFKKKKGK